MGKRRRAFTVSEKLRVVEWHQDHGAVVKRTARHFGLNPKHVRDWLACHPVLLQNNYGSTRHKLRLYSGNRAAWPQLDRDVFEYFSVQRGIGAKFSDDDLKTFALRRAEALGLSAFTASNGWLRRWKLRHGVRVRRGAKRSLPADKEEQLLAFYDTMRALRTEHQYDKSRILLMDQTTVRFTVPESERLCVDDRHKAGICLGFTVSLAMRSNGFKEPANVVFKMIPPCHDQRTEEESLADTSVTALSYSECKYEFAGMTKPNNIHVGSSSTGWLTPAILEEIIERLSDEPSIDFKAETCQIDQCAESSTSRVGERQLLLVAGTRDHTAVSSRRCASRNKLDLVVVPDGCHTMHELTFRTIGLKPFQRALQRGWQRLVEVALPVNSTPGGGRHMTPPNDQIGLEQSFAIAQQDDIDDNASTCSDSSCTSQCSMTVAPPSSSPSESEAEIEVDVPGRSVTFSQIAAPLRRLTKPLQKEALLRSQVRRTSQQTSSSDSISHSNTSEHSSSRASVLSETDQPTSPRHTLYAVPQIQHIVEVISKAWQEVWPEEIAAGFLRCGISNNLDGSEGELMDSHVQSLLFGEQIVPPSPLAAKSSSGMAPVSGEQRLSGEAGLFRLHFSDDSRLLDEGELSSWNA